LDWILVRDQHTGFDCVQEKGATYFDQHTGFDCVQVKGTAFPPVQFEDAKLPETTRCSSLVDLIYHSKNYVHQGVTKRENSYLVANERLAELKG
jgi:hypothetical protein